MRILILANYDVGLYQFRRELIKKLLESNRVSISLPTGKLVAPLEAMGCKFIETDIDRRGMNPKNDLKLFFRYRKILKQEKPDLVITYTVKPDVYGGLACSLAGISYAVNITGLGTAFQNNGLLHKLVSFLYKVGLRKAKVVFFENESNKDVFVQEHIVKEEKTCVLMGAGVNLEHYEVAQYPTDETVHFLFMGRVMQEKGINELFSAMRMLRKDGVDCFLDVLGSYEEDFSEEIEKAAAEGWLCYHGYQQDVRPFIAACHCFVLPSWHEGMANTNLESAAMGRPVITSDIPGCREAVENGVSGFTAAHKSVEELYEKMKIFCALSIDEKKQMGLQGRKRMEQLFSKDKVVEKTISKIPLEGAQDI